MKKLTIDGRGPYKVILTTKQGDLIDYTFKRTIESAKAWIPILGNNAEALIIDREGVKVWDSENRKGNPVNSKMQAIRKLAADFDAALAKYYPRGVPAGGFHNLNWAAESGDMEADRLLMMHADLVRRVVEYADEYGITEAEAYQIAYSRRVNPTPRLTRHDQPSQRARISEKTGRPTKAPSARLKRRRIQTHYNAPPGVWANPLTRVKLKSPSMATGNDPDARLLKRRRKTAKAPEGFYANPLESNIKNSRARGSASAPSTMEAWQDYFILQMKLPGERKWTTIGTDDDYRSAEARIRGLARTGPEKAWRIVTPD